jgi:hypothetical protein
MDKINTIPLIALMEELLEPPDPGFPFGFLASSDYTLNRFHRTRFSHYFHLERLVGATPGSSRYTKAWKCLISSGFSDTRTWRACVER